MTRNVNAPQSAADEGKSWDCGPTPKHIYTYRVYILLHYIYINIINARFAYAYNIYLYMYICKLHICAPSCYVVLAFLVFIFFYVPPSSLSYAKTRLTVLNRLNNILKRRQDNSIYLPTCLTVFRV